MMLPVGIEARLIEGVRQGLDHPAGRGVRQLGVAVQGDDEADVRQLIRIADVDQAVRRSPAACRRSGGSVPPACPVCAPSR